MFKKLPTSVISIRFLSFKNMAKLQFTGPCSKPPEIVSTDSFWPQMNEKKKFKELGHRSGVTAQSPPIPYKTWTKIERVIVGS